MQQFDRIGFDVELAFEIEPRGLAGPGVAWPGKAVDASVLASPIGIDRPVKRNVGRLVEGDDRAGGFFRDRCFDARGRCLQPVPAIIKGVPRFRLVPPCLVGYGAAATLFNALCSLPRFQQRDAPIGFEFLSGSHGAYLPTSNRTKQEQILLRDIKYVDGSRPISPGGNRNSR